MMKHKYGFTALLLLGLTLGTVLLAGILQSHAGRAARQEVLVVTSFYPVYIAAANVAGDCPGIRVQNLSEPQTGCLHDFQLTPEDMKLLSSADLFLVNGAGMESFLSDVKEAYPSLAIVETAKDLSISEDNGHVWMSIPRYRAQVAAIAEAICGAAPKFEREARANADAYDEMLLGLQTQQEAIAGATKGERIVSLHEAYAYLAADYGLEVVYELNLDEERQVGAKEVADALDAVRTKGARVILAEDVYGRALAETIQKEADVKVYYPDTLVRGDYAKDSYIDGMQNTINLLKEAFGE